MVRYVDNECCHVSSLHLVMSNVWGKVTGPAIPKRIGLIILVLVAVIELRGDIQTLTAK